MLQLLSDNYVWCTNKDVHKKLKIIIGSIVDNGQFNDADPHIPLFARFVHMRNKQTKRL